jgi:hypothetical protein
MKTIIVLTELRVCLRFDWVLVVQELRSANEASQQQASRLRTEYEQQVGGSAVLCYE